MYKYPMRHFIRSNSLIRLFVSTTCLMAFTCVTAGTVVRVDLEKQGRKVDISRLLGTNIALWYEPENLANEEFMALMKDWSPGLIRLPGGSWSNEYYWNGNGVRSGWDDFDHSKFKDGRWEVDYSGYAPGFRIHGTEQHLSDYHGVIDIKREHEIAESLGADQLVTVNVGTGTETMAVEWLKWAKQEGFSVPYWEIGNELNGQWEVGHFLPDGTGMTGEVYAQKYLEYSRALKAVDPTVKTGGPACSDLNLAFVEELIRDAGDELDFISIHAYPVGVQRVSTEDKFADINLLREALGKIKAWKQEYQPDRAEEIEIGITEWNMKVNEDRDTADIISGLWAATWIGTMVEEGVAFANQWDLMTKTPEGGHGAFHIGNGRIVPKPLYAAHFLWHRYMGNSTLALEEPVEKGLEIFATRTDDAVQVMFINKQESGSLPVELHIPGIRKGCGTGRIITYSRQEYFWDPHQRKPIWSRGPTIEAVDGADRLSISVPAFSIRIVQLPLTGNAEFSNVNIDKSGTPSLHLIVPESAPADLPVECWVVAWDKANGTPYRGELGAVTLEVTGPVDGVPELIRLDRSMAKVLLQPVSAGEVTLQVRHGGLEASTTLALEEVASREQVLWTFDNPVSEWGASGTFRIRMEPSVKPNEFVAAAVLENSLPGDNKDVLLLLERFPESLEKDRIGGVFGEVQVAPDLVTKDPEACVNVILQSEADHWMQLVTIPFSEMQGEWKRFQFKIEDPRLLKAMARLYAVRFQIVSTEPITGEIYFDNLGFLIRN